MLLNHNILITLPGDACRVENLYNNFHDEINYWGDVTVYADATGIGFAEGSSVCFGTLHREGSGRIKHLEIRQLWLQNKI